MQLEKFNPITRQNERGRASAADTLFPWIVRLPARIRRMRRSLRKLQKKQCACCRTAHQALAAAENRGSVTLSIGAYPFEELLLDSSPLGAGLYWTATGGMTSADISITSAGANHRVNVAGLYRLKAMVSFSATAADISLDLYIRKNGTADLPGVGRQGYIAGPPDHLIATSDIETWTELSVGDYVEVFARRNGTATGTITWLDTESTFIMERRVVNV